MSEHPRPPDWKNPHKFYRGVKVAGREPEAAIFEAGADTIYPFAFEQGKVEAIDEVLANELHAHRCLDHIKHLRPSARPLKLKEGV